MLERCISSDTSESSGGGTLNCMMEQLPEERTEEDAFASPGSGGIDKDPWEDIKSITAFDSHASKPYKIILAYPLGYSASSSALISLIYLLRDTVKSSQSSPNSPKSAAPTGVSSVT